MTLVVTDMLAAVRAVGGDVKLVGSGRVKVVAPMPLPSDLIERLRASKPELLRLLTSSRLEARPAETWSDAEEERAAIVEYDGGVSRPWAEALARLDPARVPLNVSQERWAQFIDDCGRFLDQGWATYAEGLGWGPLDLFGCDRERSPAEGDHAGLLWRIEGGKLIIMSAYAAIIETATGQQKTFHRRNNRPGELALAWELDQDRGLSGNRHPSTGD